MVYKVIVDDTIMKTCKTLDEAEEAFADLALNYITIGEIDDIVQYPLAGHKDNVKSVLPDGTIIKIIKSVL